MKLHYHLQFDTPWGLNYFRKDFFTRTEIPYAAYSADAFRSFLSTYTDSLNASFVPVEKIDKALVAEEVKKEYHEIAGRFSLVSPAGYLHPKPMLMPFLMSGVGVLGYMGPFFTEYNLNPDLLPVQYPFTYAHEMAHVLGISSEAEANLYGFLVCSRSGVPEIRFSAYFALLPYVLSNAYGLLSEEEFNEWKETISPEVKDLYNRKVAQGVAGFCIDIERRRIKKEPAFFSRNDAGVITDRIQTADRLINSILRNLRLKQDMATLNLITTLINQLDDMITKLRLNNL